MNRTMTEERLSYHAELLCNRVKKRYAHLRKRYAKQHIDCYRLYDWDIPDVRAVVDWYAGHLVVAEYIRTQTGPQWLPYMAKALSCAMNVPMQQVHIKRRRTKTDNGLRYKKMDSRNQKFTVRERDLLLSVNLDDFLDTGLYSDHRDTRVIVKDMAKSETFLNLFAYTGAFTCAAASGGAESTVTVDRSATYVQWAKENMKLNGFTGKNHVFVQADVEKYLKKALAEDKRFTLAVVDPPSFSRDQVKGAAFDINRDHPRLLQSVLKVMTSGATVFFSTNHQRFEPRLTDLAVKNIIEVTPQTIPEDYHNRQIHRCWKITV